MDRKTAIFVNGGMGRSISSIPAIEKYVEENADKDPIIILSYKVNKIEISDVLEPEPLP